MCVGATAAIEGSRGSRRLGHGDFGDNSLRRAAEALDDVHPDIIGLLDRLAAIG